MSDAEENHMQSFSEISENIKQAAKPCEANLIYPFIEIDRDKKLSVFGVYDNSAKNAVNGIGQNINFVADDYYYGLSPEFDSDKVCDALKDGAFDDAVAFEKFMDCNANFFTVPAEMEKYARALFAKTLVKMSTSFGHCFVFEQKECFNKFLTIAERYAIRDLDYDYNEEEQKIRLLGKPNYRFLSKLNDSFSVDSNGKLIPNNTHDQTLSNKLTNDYSLVKGRAYYSGVLPRVKKFEQQKPSPSNSKIKSIAIIFERSTYATMDAFDSSYIKHHRLLIKYLPLIEELDKIEDDLIHGYLDNLSEDEDYNIRQVNSFLEKSYSAHNIAVSGNIVTSDKYLIFGKRGKKTIDRNEYYCSVNGQSELCDSRVKFYKQSIYEDMPTIHINTAERIDFMGELERETTAELNIFCPASRWKLYGISLLAVMNSMGTYAKYRRFHFNILAECQAEYTLSHIINSQKTATEKFENSKIIGFKVKQYKNFFSRIGKAVSTALSWLIKSKELFTSILALAIFAIGFSDLQSEGFTINGLSSIVSIVFTVLSLVFFIKNVITSIIELCKKIPSHFVYRIVGRNDDYYVKLQNILIKKHIVFHPIAHLMMYEHIKHTQNKPVA